MAYYGYITEIKELRKHTNADRLQIATVFGNDVVVSTNLQLGDKIIYFPTDGQLSYEFAKDNNLLRTSGGTDNKGGYMDEKKRNVTTIRLRGEKSDGLILPITALSKYADVNTLKEGDRIDVLNGKEICRKYVPTPKEVKANTNQKGQSKKKVNKYPLFEQHIDTEQFAYNKHKIKEGDLVYITLKLHGTSQRTSYTLKDVKDGLFKKVYKFLFGTNGLNRLKKWEHISGTRRVVLETFGGGFYGGNEFRKQWHELFVDKLHKGESIYYEVVGYTDDGKLIMPECDNKKTKDKEFIKEYGSTTQFTYGCSYGQSDIYVYRMTLTNEDGHVIDYPTEYAKLRCEQMGVKFVPILDKFIYTTEDELVNRVKAHEDGTDPIGKTHIREGVIVRVENREKFTALKQKSFNFKVLEGIIKSDDVVDMEEEESLVE